ncbi:DUF1801 domain-containing protein [Chachezhania antarctica]|uniref:DUF1801 domain-containing protein n=1 Tax=Chachezhania antarctica TaxID=2340860 RepID=UPI000EB4FCB5|nr:DUF1801 domain-containing protein [Chachezhania antarctica]|tara:strand:- start:1864 stop:2286 length:423 start_codon:yes stop_codon:yes gene_type:complete
MSDTDDQSTQVERFLEALAPAAKAADARVLDGLFREVTGFAPLLWRGGMLGYGLYHYTYQTGHSGTSLATGFSPRAKAHSIYIMPGYQDYGQILDRLGKHRTGKACLYVNKLADIDLDVLRELIATGLRDLETRWPVHPT